MNGELVEVKEMESLVDKLDTSLSHDNENNNPVIKRYLGKGRNFLYVLMIGGLLNANIGYSQEINVIQEQEKDLVSRTIDLNYKKDLLANYMALNIANFVISHEALDMGAKDLNPVPNYFRKNRTISALYKTGTNFTALYSMRRIKKEAKKDWLYHAMEINYVALNIADFVITHGALDMGAKDLNPVANYFRKNRTISALYKTGTTLTALYCMRQIKKDNKKGAYLLLTLGNLYYGYLVHHNIQVYIQLKKQL